MGATGLATATIIGGIGWAGLPGTEDAVERPRIADRTETARELGLSEGTVTSHSSRGLATLQRALGETHAV